MGNTDCKLQALLILLLHLADVLCVSNVTLNSTINSEIVEPFQVVVFTCISTGSGIINWFSNKYIGTDSLPLQIIAAGNTTIVSSNHDPNTVATKISVTNDTGEIVIVSKLRIIISSLYLMATVSCDNGDRGLRQSINFTLQDVTLISNLTANFIVSPKQTIVFTCTTRGSGILNWQSAEYIGTDGLPLQILSIGNTTTVRSSSDPNTVATRISVSSISGAETAVITSELRIIASLKYPTATVLCYIDAELPQKITFTTTGRNEDTPSTTTGKVTDKFMPTTDSTHNSGASPVPAIAIGILTISSVLLLIGILACNRSGFCGTRSTAQPTQNDTESSNISEVSTSILLQTVAPQVACSVLSTYTIPDSQQ